MYRNKGVKAGMAEARRKRKRKQQSEYFFDYSLLFIVLFLLGFGLIMIYSASSYEAYDTYGDAAYYMKKQLIANIIGLVFMIIIANIPYTFWERFATLGYVVSMVLIFLVLTPLGISSHGARRWIGIPHTGFNLQPAEVAKLCMILFLASLVCKMGKSVRTMRGFIIMMAAPLPIAACVYLITDNLSSAIIIMGIAILMVFVASPDYKKFIIMGLSVIAAAALLVFLVVQMGDKIEGFRLARIQAWLNPESQAQDKGFQTLQALYAIGSGGIWGKGLGQSMQKLSFLPEAQNDMIFSIVCEELGLVGAVVLLAMFLFLIYHLIRIAVNSENLFGKVLVMGIAFHISLQVLINVGVVLTIIPNTGASLPFISYGGSAVLFTLAEMGIALSVNRYHMRRSLQRKRAELEKEEEQ